MAGKEATGMHSSNTPVCLVCGWSCGTFSAVHRVLLICVGLEFTLYRHTSPYMQAHVQCVYMYIIVAERRQACMSPANICCKTLIGMHELHG